MFLAISRFVNGNFENVKFWNSKIENIRFVNSKYRGHAHDDDEGDDEDEDDFLQISIWIQVRLDV